jgi:hypothetical protein
MTRTCSYSSVCRIAVKMLVCEILDERKVEENSTRGSHDVESMADISIIPRSYSMKSYLGPTPESIPSVPT